MTSEDTLQKIIDEAAPGLRADEKSRLQSDVKEKLQNPDMRGFFEDLKKVAYASGIHPAQTILRQLVDVGDETDGVPPAPQLHAAINKYNEKEFMGRSFKFGPELKDFKDVEFALIVDVCEKGHDMTKQLNQLTGLPAQAIGRIKQEMGLMISFVKSVYQMLAAKEPQLFEHIQSRLNKKYPSLSVKSLLIDKENTTLYVIESLPQRVGLYLHKK